MRLVLVLTAAAAALAAADTSSSGLLSADVKAGWSSMKGTILKAAEKMPEEHYSFKPAPDVRSYGAVVGHIADAHYLLCAPARGEKKGVADLTVEKTKTTKADLLAALKESIAYCDAAYDAITDTSAADAVEFFGRKRARLTVLHINLSHDNEHYGNLATYLRMKGLVPPTSEKRAE